MLVLTKELNGGVKLCTYAVAISAMVNNSAAMIDDCTRDDGVVVDAEED